MSWSSSYTVEHFVSKRHLGIHTRDHNPVMHSGKFLVIYFMAGAECRSILGASVECLRLLII
jgi:hypothetical protein